MLHPRLDPPAPGPLAALGEFRRAFYRRATRWPDALFELTDAHIVGHAVTGLPPPHLSLEPIVRRGHGSAYAALSKGRLAADQLGDCLVQFRPRAWPLVFLRSTPRAGPAATRRPLRSGATTTTPPATPTGSRSWPAGTPPGSPS